ncbi:MAG: hypothetical protein MJD61_21680 [Proteobacteria bacterium]|nr:hypothetical protein [Pseudomonadota bacterium]
MAALAAVACGSDSTPSGPAGTPIPPDGGTTGMMAGTTNPGVGGAGGAVQPMAGTVAPVAGTIGAAGGLPMGGAAGGLPMGGAGGLPMGGLGGSIGAAGTGPMAMPKPTVGAQGVTITRVELNQSNAIPLVTKGMPAKKAPHAIIVGGRPALFRGYWELSGGGMKSVIGILTIQQADGSMTEYRDTKMVKKPSKPIDSGQVPEAEAFNWKVEAANVKAGMEFFIELFEDMPGGAPTPAPRLPMTGTIPVRDVDDEPSELTVVIVPVKAAGEVPAHAPENVMALEDDLFDTHPVQKVNMVVKPPTKIRGLTTSLDKTGVKDAVFPALEAMCKKDGSKVGVLYQAILSKTKFKNVSQSWGGTARGRNTGFNTPCWRNALNWVGYYDYKPEINGKTDFSVTHEFGHLLERPHPDHCGATGGAPNPYRERDLGSQGYRLRTGAFFHNDGMNSDYMGYCRPRWATDWTSKQIHPVLKMITKRLGSTPTSPELESSGLRTVVTYSAIGGKPGRKLRWLEFAGDSMEPHGMMPDSYAQVWVNGRASQRLAVSAVADEDGDAERIAFTLPYGVSGPERVVLVHRGERLEIDGGDLEIL